MVQQKSPTSHNIPGDLKEFVESDLTSQVAKIAIEYIENLQFWPLARTWQVTKKVNNNMTYTVQHVHKREKRINR